MTIMCDNREMEGVTRPIGLTESIGLTLRFVRKHRGLSQSDLAIRCSLGRGQLSHYESGRLLMNIHTLVRVLEVLAISPSEFFRLTEKYNAGATPPHLIGSLEVREALAGLRTALDRLEAAIDRSESL